MKLSKMVTLSSLVVLGSLTLATASVLAVDGGIYGSNGRIQFTPNTDPTNPVDPIDPTEPIDPIDPIDPEGPNPGTNGPLSIDFASSLDFGIQKITSTTETYKAASQKFKDKTGAEQEGPNFVQVTDNRGTEAGWTLTVKQDEQFTSTTDKVLTGAAVTLNNGEISTASDSAVPEVIATITLKTDGTAHKVMAAGEAQGAGTYLTRWGSDVATAKTSISLEVPGSTTKYAEVYSASFTWALTDVPNND